MKVRKPMSKLNLIRVERSFPKWDEKTDNSWEEKLTEYKVYRRERWGSSEPGNGVYSRGDTAFYHYEGAQIERDLWKTSTYWGGDPWRWTLEGINGTFAGSNSSQTDLIKDVDMALRGERHTVDEQERANRIAQRKREAKEKRDDATAEYLKKIKDLSDPEIQWLAQHLISSLNSEERRKMVMGWAKPWEDDMDNQKIVKGISHVLTDLAPMNTGGVPK
jgi:hypothetical protein